MIFHLADLVFTFIGGLAVGVLSGVGLSAYALGLVADGNDPP